jgi:hypothetical protein
MSPKRVPDESPLVRIKSLKWVIEEFLEEDLSYDELRKDPDRAMRLEAGLREHLFRSSLGHFDDDEDDNGDDSHPARRLSAWHAFLRREFWDKFKNDLILFKEQEALRAETDTLEMTRQLVDGLNLAALGPEMSEPGSKEGLARMYYDEIHREQISLQQVESFTLNLRYSFETGVVQFFTGPLEVLRNLMSLFQGLPIDKIRRCKDETCNRCFIIASMHNRDYCSNLCASRSYQKKMQREDPEGYKRKFRQRYREKVLGRKN